MIATAMFIAGMLAGSFAGLCIYRIPRGESVVSGPSRCDHCQSPLGWRHKLPLIGFLARGGRSRCCGKKIPLRYPGLEISLGMMALLFYRVLPDLSGAITALVLTGFLAAGMFIDLDRRLIPDKVTLTGIAAALLLAILIPQNSVQEALLGTMICGGFLLAGGLFGEFLFGKQSPMGGGDIKFAAMIGAFVGWELGLAAILIASIAGFLAGSIRIAFSSDPDVSREICFGPFLGLGGLVILFWGNSILNWYLSTIGWSGL